MPYSSKQSSWLVLSADSWGRKPLFLAGFAILPVRAVLYTLSDNSFWLIGVQVLDGVGAGIFGALTPLVITDIMRGTGRYNLAQGAIATVQGIGASLSGLAAGVIVDHFGTARHFSRWAPPPSLPQSSLPFGSQKPLTKEQDHQGREPQLCTKPTYVCRSRFIEVFNFGITVSDSKRRVGFLPFT